jgi:hypothetical protein
MGAWLAASADQVALHTASVHVSGGENKGAAGMDMAAPDDVIEGASNVDVLSSGCGCLTKSR